MLTAYRAHTPPKAQPQNKTRIAQQFTKQSLFPEDSQTQLHSKAKEKRPQIDVVAPPLFSTKDAETL